MRGELSSNASQAYTLIRKIPTIVALSSLVIFLLVTTVSTHAQLEGDLKVEVERVINVNAGGAVIINDTVTILSENGAGSSLKNFSVCIPRELQVNLAKISAFGPNGKLKVLRSINIRRSDLTCFLIVFPGEVALQEGATYRFSIVYAFTNLIKALSTTTYHLEFPQFPVIPFPVRHYNLKVILPEGAVEPNSPLPFNETRIEGKTALGFYTEFVKAFSRKMLWVDFNITGFQIIDVYQLERKVLIDNWGNVRVEDRYYIVNRSPLSLTRISLRAPKNATSISVSDIYGGLTASVKREHSYVEVSFNLREPLQENKGVKILLAYSLPRSIYLKHEGLETYHLIMKPFVYNDWWIIRKLRAVVILPEGAEHASFTVTPSFLERDSLQETLTFTIDNATYFDEFGISVTYNYGVLWPSFRPTVWSVILVSICASLLYLRQPPRPVLPAISLPLGTLREFINKYEEKRRILRSIENIERQVRRGKISRRRYKVRRDSLERRLSKLQRSLNTLRSEIETVSVRYAELMKDLEVAETELETVKASIERLRVRYRRREISTEAYNRLLEEYDRRRERAEGTIDEVILRLEEDLR